MYIAFDMICNSVDILFSFSLCFFLSSGFSPSSETSSVGKSSDMKNAGRPFADLSSVDSKMAMRGQRGEQEDGREE